MQDNVKLMIVQYVHVLWQAWGKKFLLHNSRMFSCDLTVSFLYVEVLVSEILDQIAFHITSLHGLIMKKVSSMELMEQSVVTCQTDKCVTW